MNNLQKRIVSFLKLKNADIEQEVVIKLAIKAGYAKDKIYQAIKELSDTQANIGVWKDQKTRKTYCRYYTPDELTNQVQECLDRGDAW